MRILQVITSLNIGGAEKLIVDMVPLYKRSGHQVDVLLFDGTKTPFKRKLQESGVHIIEFGKGGSVYNPWYIFKLIPILRKYDIIHTHNTACQLFVAIASVLCSVVLVTTEHNTSNRRRNWKWYRLIDKWMYNRYKAIVCISDKASENLCQYLGVSKHIYTIYNGIDCEIFRTAQTNQDLRNGKQKVVTMVAGFRYQKDQDTLIKAFLYLPKGEYVLWLVGDGERRPVLEALVQNLNLQDSVCFWGNRSDIPVILKSSDIIVMSSHFEGLSLSSIEGMCVNKPFVASDVDGLHEITEGAGILFPHGDAKALAKICMNLMKDRNYYQQIADCCLQRALGYDIHKTVKEYLAVYRKMLE